MSIIIAHATRTRAMRDAFRNTPWSNGNEIYCTFCVRVLRDFAYMYQSLFSACNVEKRDCTGAHSLWFMIGKAPDFTRISE